jgi:hypothetical protein
MPMLNHRHEDSSDSTWAKTIVRLIEDKKLMKEYADKGKKRMKELDLNNINDEWGQLLQKI